MSKVTEISNVITKEKLREVQRDVLKDLSDRLAMSFGPMGSNTCIKKLNAENKYSKDGHTILSSIYYNGIIEQSIKDDIESITRYITTTVGDGTTSAVILSQLIFESFINDEEFKDCQPAVILDAFKEVVKDIKDKIHVHSRNCTEDDIYNISMISTNGNSEVSTNLKNIYKEFGMNVFIDVLASTGTDSYLKNYDGMTLPDGFCNICFINDQEANNITIEHPKIYFFKDPIDTNEMLSMLNSIVMGNIMQPIENQQDPIPTVILAPHISRDLGGYMSSLMDWMNKIPVGSRPPLLIVNDVTDDEKYDDLYAMCDAKYIRKYIDPELQKTEQEAGRAPTKETICGFFGTCERVISDANKTKFINPSLMRNEDGTYTDEFNRRVNYLESELAKQKEQGADANVTGGLKRRINSLKSNMVEYYVGGITMADRDSLRDLVEDAVLNCRSSASYGVGYGANYEGLRASKEVCNSSFSANDISYNIAECIYESYFKLSAKLYKISLGCTEEKASEYVCKSIDAGVEDPHQFPMNLRTKKFDNDNPVLSSIESDIIILDTISKIVGLMITCNQFIVPTVQHNLYEKVD